MPRPSDMGEQLAVDEVGETDGDHLGDEPVSDRFRSRFRTSVDHVFGGLLVAQALQAAAATVDRPVHSIHGSFLSGGAPGEHLVHRVERTRDGSSFATRRVTTSQNGRPTFVLTADFQAPEDGARFETPAVEVPGPDGLDAGRYDNPLIESRDVPAGVVDGGPPLMRSAWFRVRRPLGDDPAVHAHTLAYLSDFGATRAVRAPHEHLADDARRRSVSLTHSVWFHGPVDANGWILSSIWPMATGNGRGLAIGTLRDLDGALLATVAQEALLRSV